MGRVDASRRKLQTFLETMGKDEKEEAVEGEEDVQRNEAEKGVEPEHDVIEGMKNMEKGIAPLGEPKPYDDLIHPEEANMKDPGELLLEEGEWKKNDMFFEYRLKEGEALRLQGNELFKEGKFSEAAVKYRKGLYYSVFDDSQFNFELQDEHRLGVVKTVVPLRLNYALCLLKDTYEPLRRPLPSLDDRYSEAAEHCTEVLNWFNPAEPQEGLQAPDKVKALYRRGLARIGIKDLDRAKEDLKEALKLEPGNKDVRRELGNIKELQKEDLGRQKALWSGAVETLAKKNEEVKAKEEAEEAAAREARGETPEEKKAKIAEMLAELEAQDEQARQLGWWGGLKKLVGWG